jgi:CRISPR-associated protein Cas2
MTIVITRDVEDRYRGFLSSCMLEVSAGCYISPVMTAGVRHRIWSVMDEWWTSLRRGTVLMLWTNKEMPGDLGLKIRGEPMKDIVDIDGVFLVRKDTSAAPD